MAEKKYRQDIVAVSTDALNSLYMYGRDAGLTHLRGVVADMIKAVTDDTDWEVVGCTDNNVIFRRYVEVDP